jgi:hypothetical protein
MNRLPEELVHHIFSYTYRPQKPELLDDIRNFTHTRDRLFATYRDFHVGWENQNEEEDEELEYKWWIVNDIIRFMNSDQATANGYVDNFYYIFLRTYQLHTEAQAYNYISILQNKPLMNQINTCWGILNPSERLHMLSEYG